MLMKAVLLLCWLQFLGSSLCWLGTLSVVSFLLFVSVAIPPPNLLPPFPTHHAPNGGEERQTLKRV
jgi:hypothetical protein